MSHQKRKKQKNQHNKISYKKQKRAKNERLHHISEGEKNMLPEITTNTSKIEVAKSFIVKRGEVYMIYDTEFDDKKPTSVQRGTRPGVILQNRVGNEKSPTVIVAKATAVPQKTDYPMHQHIDLEKPSTILFEQIATVDKSQLIEKIGELTEEEMIIANQKLMHSLGLDFFNLTGVEVKSRTIKTKRKGTIIEDEVIYDIRIQNAIRFKNITVPLRELTPIGIDIYSDFDTVEKALESFKGIQIINKFTLEG